ncbi:MAG: hypothetical protein IIU97_04775 [Bacteroidaceae bacterium]|nr:hypothetical protein [Bacteroidaceae bacterium]
MNKNFNWKNIVPHIAAVLTFLLLTLVYFSPVLEGKDIKQDDAIGSMGWGKDARDYHEESGEYSYWSNAMFSGMPCNYTFSPQPDNVFKPIGEVVTLNIFGASYRHIGCIFLTFIGCYILLLALGCRPWLSIAGSIAYTLGSYNFIIIDAGHMNKSLVIATMAPLIGGIILCYRRKLLIGALVTLVFAGLNIYWSHQQVSYYVLLTAIIMAIVYFIYAWRDKWLKYYFKATGVLAVVAILAAAPAVGILLPTSDYAKSSMRGGSELDVKDGEKSTGLDTEYAFAWSYGKAESLTLLVPNLYGSASASNVGTDSELYKAYRDIMIRGYADMVLEQNPGASEREAVRYITGNREIMREINADAANFVRYAPTYWGEQPGTSGPVYAGAIVCFLFVLGLIIVRGAEKWWLLGATLFSLILAWGSNMPGINNFLFEYMPLYNKFRAPSMALVITTLTMSALAILAVKRFIEDAKNDIKLSKALYIALGITGGITLLLAVVPDAFFNFTSTADTRFAQIPELLDAMIQQRRAMLVSDAWRSFAFIAATAALMWAYTRYNLKQALFIAMLGVLFLVDMWPVCKRFVNNDKFMPKKETTAIRETAADKEVRRMAGNDPHYRVFNLTDPNGPFNEAFTSYKHNSIGGYSPAKLARYQDIIERYLSKFNMNVISMLNTRFFITPDGVEENYDAFGNCWTVNNVVWVENAKEEIVAIENVDKETAYIDKAWLKSIDSPEQYNNAAPGIITMTEYRNPGNIIYRSNSAAPKLAVFSEVYYKTWKAYIDGEEVTPVRANYILRALPIPAGEHTIEFKCVDELMIKSHNWSTYMSILVAIVILGLAGFGIYRNVKKEK